MNVPAIVNTAPGVLEMTETPLSEPGPQDALVSTLSCGVCATDLEMIDGWDRTGFPAIPGHEWSGRVEALGNGADPALLGRVVVGDNILPDGGEVGFEHPGGYATRFITRADNLFILPDKLAASDATLIEPLAVCLRGIRKAKDILPADALIFGDGPIGLLSLLLLRHFGSKSLTIVGGRQLRLTLATSIGASATVNYHEADDLADSIQRVAGRTSWPLIVETSGTVTAMESALTLGRNEARIVALGDYGAGRAGFPWNTLLHKELHLLGSNTGSGAWGESVGLASSLPLSRLITHRFPAAEFLTAVQTVRDRTSGSVKVVLEWE